MKTSILPLSPQLLQAMQASGVWKDWCPVPLNALRHVVAPYVDFAGTEHANGEMVVHESVAAGTAELFTALFKMRFPINSMRSIHHFGGDDAASMAANNSSAFITARLWFSY